jgi:hypothetical protein
MFMFRPSLSGVAAPFTFGGRHWAVITCFWFLRPSAPLISVESCRAWPTSELKQGWLGHIGLTPEPRRGTVGIEQDITMTITVDIRPEVQAELARQAAASGSAIETYVANLLEGVVHLPHGENRAAFDKERAKAAGARIRELSKGLTLGDLTIRQLIDEGRP